MMTIKYIIQNAAVKQYLVIFKFSQGDQEFGWFMYREVSGQVGLNPCMEHRMSRQTNQTD